MIGMHKHEALTVAVAAGSWRFGMCTTCRGPMHVKHTAGACALCALALCRECPCGGGACSVFSSRGVVVQVLTCCSEKGCEVGLHAAQAFLRGIRVCCSVCCRLSSSTAQLVLPARLLLCPPLGLPPCRRERTIKVEV